ncbi:MAG: hypothetical protein IPJ32_00200 [Sphingobacteriaceae bacterium]|nr:hypothetical protein [Sphingobacteriaceae bacterium]
MKINLKQLAVTICLGFAAINANGQSTSADNVYGATKFLGWGLTSGDLLFKVSNATMMTLKNSTGNFGIGTTTPARRFVVSNAGTIGVEINPFALYSQITSYDRATSTYSPLVLQDPAGGNVGVGNITPGYKLSVQTPVTNDGIQVKQTGTGAAGLHLDNVSLNGHNWGIFSNGSSNFEGAGNFSIYDYGVGGSGVNQTRFLISGTTGNVGIGTGIVQPTAKLTVNGKVLVGDQSLSGFVGINTVGQYLLYVQQGILTEKVKVAVATTSNWADYVFDKNYKVRSINELDSYIKANKHLPGIPSALEVVENGIDVATMDAKLLEKIEELSLYIIELNKKIEQLEKK